MKFVASTIKIYVAPLVGAWIEIVSDWSTTREVCVAPLVGAWIEISVSRPST